jgi:spore maturation protein CgeB
MSAAAPLDIVILGLSITSSWGNGHATTYRGLVRELAARGHRVTFLERDVPWYAENRDMPEPAGCTTLLYGARDELAARHAALVRDADVVIVGSYVPDGVEVGAWAASTATGVVAFYDIDTPVTLAKLARGEHEYLTPELVARYDLYLSFTGGPTLGRLEREYGSPMARALYCSVDPALYYPEDVPVRWDLGYMGTYSDDRQPTLDRLLVEPARRWGDGRFAVVGPMYPESIGWPANVTRETHLSPREHRAFYAAQRFTLNVTRADMIAAGWSPSVRLFEAAACGTPIVSDAWDGLDALFAPGAEIVIARDADDVLRTVRGMPDDERRAMGEAARRTVLGAHTAAHRAAELEGYVGELLAGHVR